MAVLMDRRRLSINSQFRMGKELIYFDLPQQVDVSNVSFPKDKWFIRDGWEVALKSSILLPIVVLGVMANVVILTAIFNRRNRRIPINYLFASMALADLATLVISPWIFICWDIFQNFVLGPIGCKIAGYFQFSFFMIDVLNLVLITVIRLVAIAAPHKRITCKNVLITTCFVWIAGFSAASPLLIFRSYKELQWLGFVEKYCNEDGTVLPIYWNVIMICLVWLPLTILLISYSIIFNNLDKLTKIALANQHQGYVNFKKKAVKIILAVVVAFIICRIPFTVIVFWRNQRLLNLQLNTFDRDFEIVWFLSNILIFFNAAINPVMYGLTNRCYRRPLESSKVVGWMFKKPQNQAVLVQKVWTLPRLVPRRVSVGN